jgi:hypothetical protein
MVQMSEQLKKISNLMHVNAIDKILDLMQVKAHYGKPF